MWARGLSQTKSGKLADTPSPHEMLHQDRLEGNGFVSGQGRRVAYALEGKGVINRAPRMVFCRDKALVRSSGQLQVCKEPLEGGTSLLGYVLRHRLGYLFTTTR